MPTPPRTPRGSRPPNRPPNKNNRDSEGLPSKGSLAAPLLPRRYLDKRVSTIVPRIFSMFRQWMLLLSIGMVLALNVFLIERYGYYLYGLRLGYSVAAVILLLHTALFVYAVWVYVKHYKLSLGGAVMASRATITSFQSMTAKFVLLGLASVAGYTLIFVFFGKYIFASRLLEENHNSWINGLLLMSYAYLVEHFFIMRMKPDTLSCFTQEFWVSGIYKVPLDLVGSTRVVSRSSPSFVGFATINKEKRVYFEVYDKDENYIGRDMLNEGDFDAIDDLRRTRGYKTVGINDIKIPQRRTAVPKKKKNPNKKK